MLPIPVALFFISLIFFTYGLSAQEITSFDSRFYLFAKEMLSHGVSWFPTTYGQPYPDYPATSTVLIYLLSKVGGLNKLIAVLPSAIAAAFTVVVTYLIGALRDKTWGLYAVCWLFLTFTFFKEARSISLDMYPTLAAALCFYLAYSADFLNKPARTFWIYPLLIFSFLFRGPIGLVIPTGVVCAYYLLDKQFKKMVITGIIASVLLLVCTLLLLQAAYATGGTAFVQDVLRMQVMGRINNHYLPIYFYFTDSLASYALSYPCALVVAMGMGSVVLRSSDRSSDLPFLLKLLAWALIVLIGMSIPGDKKVRYVLAMSPAIALLAAYPLVERFQAHFIFLQSVILGVFLFLPSLFALAVEFIYYHVAPHLPDVSLPYLPLVSILLILQAIGLYATYYYANQTANRQTTILAIASVSFVIAYIQLVEPLEIYFDRAREFVTAVESLRQKAHAQLVFYKEKPDSTPIKYLVNKQSTDTPIFIDTPESLSSYPKPAFFVTSESYFMSLPKPIMKKMHIVARDRIGHVVVIVFAK
jgi:hypothetical protein